MAAIDPYAPCPCGSGQKFKWCCHKVEAYAERAQRLFEGGQTESAIQALDEGLRKEPGNPWLLTRKALFQIRSQQLDPAKASLRLVLQREPKHFGAHALMTRLALETEGPAEGAAQFQQALSAIPTKDRPKLASLARVVGVYLSESAYYPAAIAHLRLVAKLNPAEAETVATGLRTIEANPAVSPWLKNPYKLSPPPEGLTASTRASFEQAAQWAGEGLWSSAAAAFEILSPDPNVGREADRNLGLCRLWMADSVGAVEALRRYIGATGTTADAIDLEGLCQEIAEPDADELIEHVQLTWPLRNREALLRTLSDDPTVHELEPEPLDPDDPEAPEFEQFGLLDRPVAAFRPDLRPEEVPRFVGRVFVSDDTVLLDTYDDGRLDGLVDRFTSLAGSAVPPAHPRTTVLDKVTKSALALTWDWLVPEGMDRDTLRRLNQEEAARLLREVWPHTPLSCLRGRTPAQAARAGDAVVPLRAAWFALEQARNAAPDLLDFPELRGRLNIPQEPPIDPDSLDVGELHLARLSLVPVDRLDDQKLADLYRRARGFGLQEVVERAAAELVKRPESWEKVGVLPILIHTDLANAAAAQGKTDEAFDWIRRGRQADPVPHRARFEANWDLLEIRLKARTESPAVWVPDLAVVLDRYHDDVAANQTIMLTLLELGLVEMQPNPDRPDDVLLDTRVLQALMEKYGPRVTTASGRLGVSATKGGIWTPGADSNAGGGIWTPGSPAGGHPAPAGGEKPKLIVPGR